MIEMGYYLRSVRKKNQIQIIFSQNHSTADLRREERIGIDGEKEGKRPS